MTTEYKITKIIKLVSQAAYLVFGQLFKIVSLIWCLIWSQHRWGSCVGWFSCWMFCIKQTWNVPIKIILLKWLYSCTNVSLLPLIIFVVFTSWCICFLLTRLHHFTTTSSSMDLRHHTLSNQRRPPSLSDTTRPGTGSYRFDSSSLNKIKNKKIC